MKGEIIYKILGTLGDEILNCADFTNAILRTGYGATSNKIEHEFRTIKHKRLISNINNQRINKFKKYLSKLKSDGLILENESKKIYLSDEGKKKLNNFKNSFYLNKDLYKAKIGEKVVIISYDIPVAFNKERNILRDMLRVLGFNLIHKSVWVGRVVLPERFVIDLNKLGIMDYVEILEVTKKGTLELKN